MSPLRTLRRQTWAVARSVTGAGRSSLVGVARGLVRAVVVVVRQVLAHHGEQMTGVIDQDPVQALPPCCAYPGFRAGVRPGRLRRSRQHLDALRVQHRVEYAGVLGVPAPDQEPEPLRPFPNSAMTFGRVAIAFTQGAALVGPFLVASSGLNRREVNPEAEWRRRAISRLACWFV
jgi:hypothetical protein